MCSNVRDYTVSDTKYEYQYLYKYPEKTVPEGGEAAYIETLSTDCMGYTLDVTVIGIDGKSKYFDARPEKGKTKAMDLIFPSFIPNVACAMKLSFPWYLYVIIYFAIILVYAVINSLLIRKIRKISPAEILKNRE
jgi:ABC-type antimicrobial peptide transport system permease subunit